MKRNFPGYMIIAFLMTILLSCTKAENLAEAPVPQTVNKTRMLQVVNDARKKGCKCGDTWYPPAPPVAWNPILEKAAYQHSLEMAKNKSLTHTSSTGKGPGERIREAGYNWVAYGENIAVGYTDEKSVVDGWLSSPGHCKNLMNSSYKEMGVARSGSYWTQDFGAR